MLPAARNCALAGIEIRAAVLDTLLELLDCGVAPNSLNTVLGALCKTGGSSAARRHASAAPAERQQAGTPTH